MVLPMVFSCFFPTVEGPSRTFPLASPWIGFSAQLFSWRFSFVILALLWGFMAIYAALLSVESCPDGEQQSCWALIRIISIGYDAVWNGNNNINDNDTTVLLIACFYISEHGIFAVKFGHVARKLWAPEKVSQLLIPKWRAYWMQTLLTLTRHHMVQMMPQIRPRRHLDLGMTWNSLSCSHRISAIAASVRFLGQLETTLELASRRLLRCGSSWGSKQGMTFLSEVSINS